jgi:SAM-dependent methyltransferase
MDRVRAGIVPAWREFLARLAKPDAPPQEWRDFLRLTGASPRQPSPLLLAQRDHLLELAAIAPGERVLEIGCGLGLLAFWAAELAGPAGRVIACDIDAGCIAWCRQQAQLRDVPVPRFLRADARTLPFPDRAFDAAVFRCVLAFVLEKDAVVCELRRVLRPGGRLAFYERVNRENRRLASLLPPDALPAAQRDRLEQAEEAIHHDPNDPMLDFDIASLGAALSRAGFTEICWERVERTEEHRLTPGVVRAWLETQPAPGRPAYSELLARYLPADELAAFKRALVRHADGRLVPFKVVGVYMRAVASGSAP